MRKKSHQSGYPFTRTKVKYMDNKSFYCGFIHNGYQTRQTDLEDKEKWPAKHKN